MPDPGPSVFFIGEVSQDDYFSADRWPGVADKGYVKQKRSYVGGMIANAASVYAGLGGRPQLISLLNNSPLSQYLCRELNTIGVSTDHMIHDPDMGESRNFIFLVDNEHVVLTIDTGRAPMHLSKAAMSELCGPGYLYTTIIRAKRLRSGSEAGPSLLARFREAGRRIVFDLDVEGFKPEDAEFLRGADVLIMNRIGFELSFGSPELGQMNDWMHRHEVRTVIRTLAADGAEAFNGQDVIRVPGYQVPVVDVTGAGDTFGGALVHALTNELDLRSAIELAVAAASRSVTIEGPRGGVASTSEIERFRSQYAKPQSN